MKLILLYFTFIFSLFQFTNAQDELPLIDSSSLEYIGSFNVPQVSDDSGATFAWAGCGIAYNKINNSLFLTGHNHFQLVGEISIPDPVITSSTDDLPESDLIQPVIDITEGHISEVGEGGAALSSDNHNIKIGGMLVYDSILIGSSYPYYEDATEAKRSHFKRSINFEQSGTFDGMYTVGQNMAGLVSGYMGIIPEVWRDSLEASVITGNACIPIISRSSYGPSVATLNPDSLGFSTIIPSTSLLYYDSEHPTLGEYNNEAFANPVFCMSTKINGVVFPQNSRTVLFYGRTGLGIPEYGAGTDDITLDGTKVDNYDEYYVYDPASPLSKGTHAWPYSAYVWAYDVNDLLDVKNGLKNPWEVIPYKHWQLNMPYVDSTSECLLGGAAYDPDNGRIFVSHLRAHRDRPVIHVYKVNCNTPIIHNVKMLNRENAFIFRLSLFDNEIRFLTNNIKDNNYTIKLLMVNGKILSKKSLFLKSNNCYSVKLKNKPQKGVYIFDISDSNGNRLYKKSIVIQ